MESMTSSYVSRHNRFWEIDLLRTIAIVMMVTFHWLFVLDYLRIQNTGVPGPYHGFWWWIARVIVAVFTFLAGISVTISYSRSKKRTEFPLRGLRIKLSAFVLRGVRIFAWGMAITALTWLIPSTRIAYVRFGILHFFGIAFMLAPLFIRFRYTNLILGAGLMAAGIYLLEEGVFVDFPWLLWLGLMPHGFRTLDYTPLLPWFGLFLLGMFAGKMLYPQGNRRFRVPELDNPVISVLTLPGRHPLVVYLAQWPAIIGVVFVLYPDTLRPYVPF